MLYQNQMIRMIRLCLQVLNISQHVQYLTILLYKLNTRQMYHNQILKQKIIPNNIQLNSQWALLQQKQYLASLNQSLINQINNIETQKFFYKNRFNDENQYHQAQLSTTLHAISQKNVILLALQQKLNVQEAQYSMLLDDFKCLQINKQAEKQFYKKQILRIKLQSQQNQKKLQSQFQEKLDRLLSKHIEEVKKQCENRVKLYQQQVQQLTQNSRNYSHQLKYLQNQHREVLVKNDTIIQQTIHRELRKRDFQAQNNYLRDLTLYQSARKENHQLKQRLQEVEQMLDLLKKENNSIKGQNQSLKTRIENLQQALQSKKQEIKQLLKYKYPETNEFETNTQQPFVPIIMPIDMNLMAEIVSLKDFSLEKISQRFLQFYSQTSVVDPKKKSNSIISFTNSLRHLRQANPENNILIYLYNSLERIVKVYCPTLSYNRQLITIKDQFIKRVLNQCQRVSNDASKLYRLLELLHRCKYPVNNNNLQISTEEIKLVQIKIVKTLKKILN